MASYFFLIVVLASLINQLAHGREMPSELICKGACTAAERPSIAVPTRLAAKAFAPFPTGQIAPNGWLLDQLLLQANSLSG